MDTSLSAADAGKSVIDSNGDRLGTIERVTETGAMVSPADDVSQTVSMSLGWAFDTPPHTLRCPSIDAVAPEAVYLRSNL
ncbi:PRC-barrel domain-containing protein [Halobacteriales archaeon Cl-PHB]